MIRPYRYFVPILLVALGAALLSCGSSNPNIGRILTGITVAPGSADAQQFTNGQVLFTATGTYSLPPFSGPLTFQSPYSGSFIVANPTNPPQTIATVVSTGPSTVTVQCASGISGTVPIVASASANNGTSTVISGSGTLICP